MAELLVQVVLYFLVLAALLGVLVVFLAVAWVALALLGWWSVLSMVVVTVLVFGLVQA
jgi:hypothetical protein